MLRAEHWSVSGTSCSFSSSTNTLPHREDAEILCPVFPASGLALYVDLPTPGCRGAVSHRGHPGKPPRVSPEASGRPGPARFSRSLCWTAPASRRGWRLSCLPTPGLGLLIPRQGFPILASAFPSWPSHPGLPIPTAWPSHPSLPTPGLGLLIPQLGLPIQAFPPTAQPQCSAEACWRRGASSSPYPPTSPLSSPHLLSMCHRESPFGSSLQ